MSKYNSEPLKNSFKDFYDFVCSQLRIPLGQLSFWAFLLLAIIGAGGYGVWVELYRWNNTHNANLSGVIQAIFTYYPALVGASIFQLIFHSDKFVRSGFTFIGVSIFLITFFVFPSPGSINKFTLVGGIILALISIFIWWIANGHDGTYHDNPNPNSSTGGDTKNPLPGHGVSNATGVR